MKKNNKINPEVYYSYFYIVRLCILSDMNIWNDLLLEDTLLHYGKD